MKIRKTKGFTVLEILLCLAIILTLVSFVIRVFYTEEFIAFDQRLFERFGIGEVGRYVFIIVLGPVAYYFRLRDDFSMAKIKKIPIISKPTKYVVIFLV